MRKIRDNLHYGCILNCHFLFDMIKLLWLFQQWYMLEKEAVKWAKRSFDQSFSLPRCTYLRKPVLKELDVIQLPRKLLVSNCFSQDHQPPNHKSHKAAARLKRGVWRVVWCLWAIWTVCSSTPFSRKTARNGCRFTDVDLKAADRSKVLSVRWQI